MCQFDIEDIVICSLVKNELYILRVGGERRWQTTLPYSFNQSVLQIT
jgi:hypothetical protein